MYARMRPCGRRRCRFNEELEHDVLEAAHDAVESCDLFITAGTSSVVYPAAGFASQVSGRSRALLWDGRRERVELWGLARKRARPHPHPHAQSHSHPHPRAALRGARTHARPALGDMPERRRRHVACR